MKLKIAFYSFFILLHCTANLIEKDVQILRTPARANYDKQKGQYTSCPFCQEINDDNDGQHYIIHRAQSFIIMLNLYPYAPGHMLIIPLRHIGNLYDLTDNELHELAELMALVSKACTQALCADACNIGLNLGKDAGASIPEHLHVHVVPRKHGDTGFISVIGNAQVVDPNLKMMYSVLKKYIEGAI